MNVAAFSAISKLEATNYVGPINPPVVAAQKAWSKLRRVSGSQGSFFFFSEKRLKTIADEVHSSFQSGARLNFFHGFTPWIATKPEPPYIAWSDCTFHDYVDIYHRREEFRSDDLERIEQSEAKWLRRADRVLFTSDWAAERAVRDYGLDADRVASVGIFGEIDMPACDTYAGGKQFAFVSTNFKAKGGPVVLKAFHAVRELHPDASLVIIGDRPSGDTVGPEVSCTGFLRKEVPEEYQRLREILAGVRAVVSATSSDICPLLFVEAGYFGCPVISTRKFAIPELVDDGRTGFLLDSCDPVAFADTMCRMLECTDEYRRMREAAWTKTHRQHSRERFEERLCSWLGLVVQDLNGDLARSK